MTTTAQTRRGGHHALKRAAARRGHQTDLESFEACLAGLDDAIARAEGSLARQERELAAYDRRTASAVARLVAEGRVRPTLAWSPAAA